MIPPNSPEAQRNTRLIQVWWISWAATLVALVVLWWSCGFLKLTGNQPHRNPFLDLTGGVPLFVSIIIRWLVLPRFTDLARALVFAIVGMALAEAGGLLGIFLGGPYRDDLFILGLLGIAQFVPLHARRLTEPRGTGFIPNN